MLTFLYCCLITLGTYAAYTRKSSVAWCAVGMMVCTLAVESVSMGTSLHYLCVGAVALIGGLIVRDWAFKSVFFLDAFLNFATQAFWIVAAYDAGAHEYAGIVWHAYPFAVWTVNGVLALLFIFGVQGPQTTIRPRNQPPGSHTNPS